MHPVELEQLRMNEELEETATVLEAVAHFLEVEPSEVLDTLLVRQMMAADREVDRFVRAMRNTRRGAIGCGFVAGVAFAQSVRRAGGVDADPAE